MNKDCSLSKHRIPQALAFQHSLSGFYVHVPALSSRYHHFSSLLPLIYVTITYAIWIIITQLGTSMGPLLTWFSPTIPLSGKEGSIETLPKSLREHGLCSHSDFDDKHSFCLLWCSVSVDSHFWSPCMMCVGSTHTLLREHTHAFLLWDCVPISHGVPCV